MKGRTMQQPLFSHERFDYALDELTIERHAEARREREARRIAALASLPPQNVVLISCAAQKGDEPAEARDLYTSTLFRKLRSYAETHGSSYRILSGLHGLVRPEQVLAPYNFKLSELRWRERAQWAQRVATALKSETPPGSTFVMLAGRIYRSPLECLLVEEGFNVHVPMRRMEIFQMMEFLTAAQKAVREAA